MGRRRIAGGVGRGEGMLVDPLCVILGAGWFGWQHAWRTGRGFRDSDERGCSLSMTGGSPSCPRSRDFALVVLLVEVRRLA